VKIVVDPQGRYNNFASFGDSRAMESSRAHCVDLPGRISCNKINSRADLGREFGDLRGNGSDGLLLAIIAAKSPEHIESDWIICFE
jgi:hypothetical protein